MQLVLVVKKVSIQQAGFFFKTPYLIIVHHKFNKRQLKTSSVYLLFTTYLSLDIEVTTTTASGLGCRVFIALNGLLIPAFRATRKEDGSFTCEALTQFS